MRLIVRMDSPLPEGPTKYSQSADFGILFYRVDISGPHLPPPACIVLFPLIMRQCPPGAARELSELHPILEWLSRRFVNQ